MQLPVEIKEQYPFAPHYMDMDDELKIHYVDEAPLGKEDSDEAVIMVHGNPTWSFFYRYPIKRLKKNHRVIAIDHMGCGLSSKPEDYEYQLAKHIDNLRKLVDKLGIKKIHLILHDWGGAIGMGLAVERPNCIRSVILMNTAAFRSKRIPASIALCKLPIIGPHICKSLNGFAYPATFMAVKKPLAKEAKLGLLYPYKLKKQREAISQFVQDIPMKPGHRSYDLLMSIENNLSKVNCPKLLLWGGQDFCFDLSFLKRWQSIYPNAQSRVLPQAGHYLIEDEPKEVVTEIERFYQQL
jgi:pimeloyl-ACP methyl ester carboxylesterase